MKATLAKMNINDLNKVLRQRGIKHFKAHQLGRMQAKGWKGDKFKLPFKDMWDNIIPVMKLCDMIQEEVRFEIKIDLAFTTPSYNNFIGETKESAHKRFEAVDISTLPRFHTDLAAAVVRCAPKFKEKGYKVGVEVHDTHIHLDVGVEDRIQFSNNLAFKVSDYEF